MYIGGQIVTNGLLVNLDAANPKSYIGTGTAWKDLSNTNGVPNKNDGTLTNGAVFQSGNKGSIFFDGVNDSVIIPQKASLNSFSSFTMEGWINLSVTHKWMLASKGFGGADIGAFYIYGDTESQVRFTMYNGIAVRYDVNSSIGIGLNNWTYITGTLDSSGNGKIYLNGVNTGNTSSIVLGSNTKDIWIGNYNNGSSNYVTNGNISMFRIYNRALTPTEILQNFNATKSRYL